MTDDLDNSAPFGDDQGTGISKDAARAGDAASKRAGGRPEWQRQPADRRDRAEPETPDSRGAPDQPANIPTSRR